MQPSYEHQPKSICLVTWTCMQKALHCLPLKKLFEKVFLNINFSNHTIHKLGYFWPVYVPIHKVPLDAAFLALILCLSNIGEEKSLNI